MKLCSINCETKSHNLPLATYISGKIIFHALIYTVSFYWVASCVISIKSTEDVWESHLTSENTNHSFICLVGRKMFHEFPFSQLQASYICKTPEQHSGGLTLCFSIWVYCMWDTWSWAVWETLEPTWPEAGSGDGLKCVPVHLKCFQALLAVSSCSVLVKGCLGGLAPGDPLGSLFQAALHLLHPGQRERKECEAICSEKASEGGVSGCAQGGESSCSAMPLYIHYFPVIAYCLFFDICSYFSVLPGK